ncbi:MAG: NAD(P)H-dependent oxidoreductase subunit E [Myxococcaceae bacterium]|nr:NAD(P)H-dependent oxidoreductase subunit E [Myxococcaceae bacterium]
MRSTSDILDAHRGDPTRLVQILRDAQRECGNWLPARVITEIAAGLGLPRARVEGVAGFYAFLHLSPVGRFRVLVSDNITDQFAGSREVAGALCRRLGVKRGRVRSDGRVSVDFTSCTGLCDQAPAILVNGQAVPRVTGMRLDAVVRCIEANLPLEEWPQDLLRVDDGVRQAGPVLSATLAPGEALKKMLHEPAERVLAVLEGSKLRGRGGAGFSVATKWNTCRLAPNDCVVVCNADEGEPGTFKDRLLLMRHADHVFEGMTIAARFTGATAGFVYLRGEYEFLAPHLREVLHQRRAAKLLGTSIAGERGFDFDIDVHLGAGAYVCGEETALLESLEGKRGVPRHKPPFPVTHGYLGRPTVVNNVETFADAAWLFANGLDAWGALGTPQSSGTKLLSVAGDVERPGIYEVPWGTTLREVLTLAGAERTKAVQVGGPSAELVPPSMFDRRLAFEDLPCAGAIAVFNDSRDLLDVVVNYAHFFAHESCGFCTPCRVGTHVATRSLDKLRRGQGSQSELNELNTLTRLLRDTSHCGLGATAPNGWRHYLDRFQDDLQRRLSVEFQPAFDVEKALAAARVARGDEP